MITLTLDGIPVAKGRARFGNGRTYTPAKTQHYESYGKLVASQVMAGRVPFDGWLVVSVTAQLPVPQSWSKAKRTAALDGLIRPTSKPDLDNYIKCLDAFNEIVWKDDSQIVELSARKIYSETPKLIVEVTPS